MVRHVYEAVLMTDGVEHGGLREKFGLHHRLPFLELQLRVSAVGERHEVAMVLITSSGKRRVELLYVETFEDALLHFARHVLVIDNADGFATLTRADAHRNLLHSSVVGIVVHLHLGVLRKLEGVSLIRGRLGADKDKREAESYDVVQIHNIVETVRRRHLYETSEHAVGNFDDGILHLAVATDMAFLHDEVDAVVLQCVEVVNSGEPYRIG